MVAKLHKMYDDDIGTIYAFHCPGCEGAHSVRVNAEHTNTSGCWGWNGSEDSPTFTPSILVDRGTPGRQCHSFVKDGMIQFLSDCWHSLAGQTVEIPAWNE